MIVTSNDYNNSSKFRNKKSRVSDSFKGQVKQ